MTFSGENFLPTSEASYITSQGCKKPPRKPAPSMRFSGSKSNSTRMDSGKATRMESKQGELRVGRSGLKRGLRNTSRVADYMANIWANRMTGHQKLLDNADGEPGRTHVQDSAESSAVQPSQPFSLHAMPENQRLAKHLKVLHALAESESLSTENTEEAVSDFDDRLKRAQGKAKIIERIVGENQGDATAVAGTKNGAST